MLNFTLSVEIPRFTIDIPVKAESFEAAVAKFEGLKLGLYINVTNGAEWIDSDPPRLVAVLAQD